MATASLPDPEFDWHAQREDEDFVVYVPMNCEHEIITTYGVWRTTPVFDERAGKIEPINTARDWCFWTHNIPFVPPAIRPMRRYRLEDAASDPGVLPHVFNARQNGVIHEDKDTHHFNFVQRKTPDGPSSKIITRASLIS